MIDQWILDRYNINDQYLIKARSLIEGNRWLLPVIIKNLPEHPWMPVEEVFVKHRVVVGECLRQPGQSRGRDLAQSSLVGLVPDASHVQHDAVLGIQVHCRHTSTASAID